MEAIADCGRLEHLSNRILDSRGWDELVAEA